MIKTIHVNANVDFGDLRDGLLQRKILLLYVHIHKYVKQK